MIRIKCPMIGISRWGDPVRQGDQCELCSGKMEHKRVLTRFRFKGHTIYVENVPAWVCNKCGEQYYDASVYKRLERIAQQGDHIQKTIFPPSQNLIWQLLRVKILYLFLDLKGFGNL